MFPEAVWSAVTETLLGGKLEEEHCDKIKQIPMSASSAAKKSEFITQVRHDAPDLCLRTFSITGPLLFLLNTPTLENLISSYHG